MSQQQPANSKSSNFGFSTLLVALVGLLLLGLTYLMLNGSSRSEAADPVEKQVSQMRDAQAETLAKLESQLSALAENNASLNQQIADLKTKFDGDLAASMTASTNERIDQGAKALSKALNSRIDGVEAMANTKLAGLSDKIDGLKVTAGSAAATAVVAAKTAPVVELPTDLVNSEDLAAAVGTVDEKLSAFEASVKTQFGQMDAKLSAETAGRVASFDLAAANLAAVDNKNAGEITSVSGVVVGLTAATSKIQDGLSALETKTTAIEKNASLSANRLLAASRLRTAIASDEAFDAELAYLAKFSAGDQALTDLSNSVSTIAATGVTPLADVQSEFQAISTRLLDEELAALAKQGSKSDQLKAGLVSLLGVTNEDGSAVVTASESKLEVPLAAIQSSLAANDLAAAVEGVDGLGSDLSVNFTELKTKIGERILKDNAATLLDAWISNLGSN